MSIGDLRRAQKESSETQAKKKDQPQTYRSTLVSYQGNVTLQGDRRFVWHSPTAGGVPSPVYNEAVTPVAGLPVIIGIPEGSQTEAVLYRDPERALDTPENKDVGVFKDPHGTDHAWGGHDLTYIYLEAIVPLMVYPTPESFYVHIVGGDYVFNGQRKTYPGSINNDMSGHKPASSDGKRLIGVYINASGLAGFVSGPLTDLETRDIPEPSWPEDVFQLSVITITEDYTGLLFSDIKNRRVLWSSEVQPDATGNAAYVEAELDYALSRIVVDNNL